MSDSLRPLGLYSPWNSPGQNTGVGSLSLLQGIFPTQVSCTVGRFFTNWATGKPVFNKEICPKGSHLKINITLLTSSFLLNPAVSFSLSSCYSLMNKWSTFSIFFQCPFAFSIHEIYFWPDIYRCLLIVKFKGYFIFVYLSLFTTLTYFQYYPAFHARCFFPLFPAFLTPLQLRIILCFSDFCCQYFSLYNLISSLDIKLSPVYWCLTVLLFPNPEHSFEL